MRVRLNRSSSNSASKPGRPARRLHAVPAPAPSEQPPRPAAAERPERTPEDVWRQAGGPEDRSTYACRCGYVFEADVSTSVTCPHCGCGQAW
jgi:hypothetical protein